MCGRSRQGCARKRQSVGQCACQAKCCCADAASVCERLAIRRIHGSRRNRRRVHRDALAVDDQRIVSAACASVGIRGRNRDREAPGLRGRAGKRRAGKRHSGGKRAGQSECRGSNSSAMREGLRVGGSSRSVGKSCRVDGDGLAIDDQRVIAASSAAVGVRCRDRDREAAGLCRRSRKRRAGKRQPGWQCAGQRKRGCSNSARLCESLCVCRSSGSRRNARGIHSDGLAIDDQRVAATAGASVGIRCRDGNREAAPLRRRAGKRRAGKR